MQSTPFETAIFGMTAASSQRSRMSCSRVTVIGMSMPAHDATVALHGPVAFTTTGALMRPELVSTPVTRPAATVMPVAGVPS